mmetsp:Transcript_32925/g.59378  ORF Transcript_32925/g.59378 Transcript_32925/m.59378 type:complete len:221 (+) Transcript_32925:1741-2403(+)
MDGGSPGIAVANVSIGGGCAHHVLVDMISEGQYRRLIIDRILHLDIDVTTLLVGHEVHLGTLQLIRILFLRIGRCGTPSQHHDLVTVHPPPANLNGRIATLSKHLDQHNIVLIRILVEIRMLVQRIRNQILIIQFIRFQTVRIERHPLLAQIGLANLNPIECLIGLVRARGRVLRTMCRRHDQVGSDEDAAAHVNVEFAGGLAMALELEGGHVGVAVGGR